MSQRIVIRIRKKTAEAIGAAVCGALFAIPFLVILASM